MPFYKTPRIISQLKNVKVGIEKDEASRKGGTKILDILDTEKPYQTVQSMKCG